MAEDDWHNLLDHAQHLFWASSIPLGLTRLLHHLLAVCHAPAPSKTLLAKVLVVFHKKSLEAACQQIWDFGMELPPPLHHARKGLGVYAAPLKLDASSQASRALNQDEIYYDGWLKWQRKNLRWCGHGSMS